MNPGPRGQEPLTGRLLALFSPYRGALVLAFILLVLNMPLSLVHPLIWKYGVDEIILNAKHSHLGPALLIMLGAHILATALGGWRQNILEKTGSRLVMDLRHRVFSKLQNQSLSYFHKNKTGELMTRTMDDVSAIQEVAVRGVDSLITEGLRFVIVCGLLIYLQWKVALCSMVPLALVAVANRLFNRRAKPIYRAARDSQGNLAAKLNENLQGITVIKAFATEQAEEKAFARLALEHLEASFRAVNIRSIFIPTTMGIGFLSNIAMLGLGVVFILRGEFTLGGLTALRGYWWMFYSPINTLAQMNDVLQRAGAAARRVFEVLDAEESLKDPPSPKALPPVKGALDFDKVTFGYDPQRPVLKGLSLSILPGQKIALVGESGGGKSTLLSLIPRFFDPQEGRVLLDGLPLKDLTRKGLRQTMALVQQESFLFDGTIGENLRYGKPGASMAEVESAARAANAEGFIQDMPRGYDTLVGERGVRLSGGQKQRISVARAFLKDPRILILDEPTSSVEPESEWAILKALEDLMKGRTTLLTSHRLSLVRDADLILVLDQGRIREQGSHQDLLKKSDIYQRMWELQTGERL